MNYQKKYTSKSKTLYCSKTIIFNAFASTIVLLFLIFLFRARTYSILLKNTYCKLSNRCDLSDYLELNKENKQIKNEVASFVFFANQMFSLETFKTLLQSYKSTADYPYEVENIPINRIINNHLYFEEMVLYFYTEENAGYYPQAISKRFANPWKNNLFGRDLPLQEIKILARENYTNYYILMFSVRQLLRFYLTLRPKSEELLKYQAQSKFIFNYLDNSLAHYKNAVNLLPIGLKEKQRLISLESMEIFHKNIISRASKI